MYVCMFRVCVYVCVYVQGVCACVCMFRVYVCLFKVGVYVQGERTFSVRSFQMWIQKVKERGEK